MSESYCEMAVMGGRSRRSCDVDGDDDEKAFDTSEGLRWLDSYMTP